MGRHRWAVGVLAGLMLLTGCGGGGSGEAESLAAEGGKGGNTKSASKDQVGSFTAGAARPGGKILADSGFRSDVNGLPFPNYPNGPGITNLTPEDLRSLWGEAVCSAVIDGACQLTPPAALVMDELNAVMDGGHCFGLSVASLLMAKKQLDPAVFGSSTVAELPFEGNTALQRRIALGFITQVLDSVREKALVGPPNAVLDFLRAHLADRAATETYTLGIHLPDGSGGHAVTPYAVVDRGKGKFGLQVYDNNFPGEAREISFDRKKNSWSYYASPNPDEPFSLYQGDAVTLSMELFPTTPGLGPQPCPFCRAGLDTSVAAPPLGTVFVAGNGRDHPRMLLTDAQGRRTGYVKGKLLQEIPGVRVEHRYYDRLGVPAGEPAYRVPLDADLTVTLDASGLKKPADAMVGFVGQGFSVAVDDLEFDPGQKDELTLPGGEDGFSYTPGAGQSPTFEVGGDFADAGFALQVDTKDVAKGSTFSLGLTDQSLTIDATGKAGAFDVAIRRIDGKGEELFDHDGLKLKPGASGELRYDEFSQSGQPVTYRVKQDDGTVDEEKLKDEDEDDAAVQRGSRQSSTTSTKPKSSTTSTTGRDADAPGSSSTTSTTGTRGTGPAATTTTAPGRRPAGGADSGEDPTPAAEPTTTTTAPDEAPAEDPPEAPPEDQPAATTTTAPAPPATPPEGPPPG